MEFFVKTANACTLLTISAKSFFLDVRVFYVEIQTFSKNKLNKIFKIFNREIKIEIENEKKITPYNSETRFSGTEKEKLRMEMKIIATYY